MDQPDTVAALVKLNGGRIVGKTRLQKTVYLLKSCGIDLGFDFDYHHYGPYSEELSIASGDAVALKLINLNWNNAYGNEYAIFSIAAEPTTNLPNKTRDALTVLERHDATTLELAATADFLLKNGFPKNAWQETERRKASKITPARVESAKQLLQEIYSLAN